MSYLCYRALNNKVESERSLEKIVQFVPRIENGISNFAPANHLVSAWAIRETSNADKANEWLEGEIKKLPGNKILLWVKEMFHGNQPALIDNNDASMRLLHQVAMMNEMKR